MIRGDIQVAMPGRVPPQLLHTHAINSRVCSKPRARVCMRTSQHDHADAVIATYLPTSVTLEASGDAPLKTFGGSWRSGGGAGGPPLTGRRQTTRAGEVWVAGFVELLFEALGGSRKTRVDNVAPNGGNIRMLRGRGGG